MTKANHAVDFGVAGLRILQSLQGLRLLEDGLSIGKNFMLNADGLASGSRNFHCSTSDNSEITSHHPWIPASFSKEFPGDFRAFRRIKRFDNFLIACISEIALDPIKIDTIKLPPAIIYGVAYVSFVINSA